MRPTLAGVCGTDMALLTGHASAILSPFASFPAVLGHEVVGVVEEDGRRVVVDPIIGCAVRGLEPCRRCAAGQARFCERATEGAISPGLLIGYCADLPGGWSDAMAVHRSQLHAIPDALLPTRPRCWWSRSAWRCTRCWLDHRRRARPCW